MTLRVNKEYADIQSEISELDRLLTEHGMTTGLFAFGHERFTALLRGMANQRDDVLEEAAKVVDYEFDRLYKEVYGRSGNAGVTTLRTRPLEVVAEQIRALKEKP